MQNKGAPQNQPTVFKPVLRGCAAVWRLNNLVVYDTFLVQSLKFVRCQKSKVFRNRATKVWFHGERWPRYVAMFFRGLFACFLLSLTRNTHLK